MGMSNVMAPLPKNDPLILSWEDYKKTAEFENTKHWASKPEHVDGSLWAAFMAGYTAACTRAETDLYEAKGVIESLDRENHNLRSAKA